MNFSTHFRAAQGLPPVADALAGTVYSDIVRCDGGKVIFILQRGAGASGRSTLTVEACKDVSPTETAAVPFRYKEISGVDVEGELTEAAAAGYQMTAGANRIDIIEVDAARLAAEGFAYCRLKAVDTVSDPMLLGILILVEKSNHIQDVMASRLT